MDNKQLWIEICDAFTAFVTAREDIKERDFQSFCENIFEHKLAWGTRDLLPQVSLPLGAGQTALEPDLLFRIGQRTVLVAELKVPYGVKKDTDVEKQLASYLGHERILVGMLIDEAIHLYYESTPKQLEEVLNLPFHKDNPMGERFVELLHHESFSQEALLEFCKAQQRVVDVKDYILSEPFQKSLYKAMRSILSETSQYSSADIEQAMRDVQLSIGLREEECGAEMWRENLRLHAATPSYSLPPERLEDMERSMQILRVKRRVPGWFKQPGQINTRILLRALELMKDSGVCKLSELRNACRDIDSFDSNFSQMSNPYSNNHALVFTLHTGERISLWKPVAEFIERLYAEYKGIDIDTQEDSKPEAQEKSCQPRAPLSEGEVEKLLRGVGIAFFMRYYDLFEDSYLMPCRIRDIAQERGDEITDSFHSMAAAGRSIFYTYGCQQQALEWIANNVRDEQQRNEARRLLKEKFSV